ncbi:hypothetical protein XENOCAPTIV_023643, partial [Xenoophorus captivus]
MRAWRKRKRDLDLLLCYSDGEDEHRDFENNRWPHSMSITTTERALKEKINPEDDWMTFPLIKDLGMQYQVVQGMKFFMVIATGQEKQRQSLCNRDERQKE